MSEEARLEILAIMEREMAELERQSAPLKPRRLRTVSGPSIVYSIRLDPEEVAMLEAQAAARDLPPTVLAQNFVRIGLAARHSSDLAGAVDRLGQAVEEVRALVR